ncbi:hypothetical protein V7S43_013492 [Phytophthora oleae]|uniref:Cyclic nucleotide-binding domain-containing protein n=1 Tax=Phytophthora oleae TaxID=2107226 RepID=A0ABD3F6H2_9STRA
MVNYRSAQEPQTEASLAGSALALHGRTLEEQHTSTNDARVAALANAFELRPGCRPGFIVPALIFMANVNQQQRQVSAAGIQAVIESVWVSHLFDSIAHESLGVGDSKHQAAFVLSGAVPVHTFDVRA